MLSRRCATVLLLLTGCASNEAAAPHPDFSGERLDIRIERGGFVDFAGERVPLEECILRLRQRQRSLTKAQRKDIWVHLEVVRQPDPQLPRDQERLLQELRYLGFGGIEVVL